MVAKQQFEELAGQLQDIAQQINNQVIKPLGTLTTVQKSEHFLQPDKAQRIADCDEKAALVRDLHKTVIAAQQQLTTGLSEATTPQASGAPLTAG